MDILPINTLNPEAESFVSNIDKLKDKKSDDEDLREVCQQFESIFLNYLLKSMRDTVPDGGMFKKGIAFDIVQSMHDSALSEEIAKSGGIGLAEQLYAQLSKYE
ncbi:rod-binding protein [Tepidanaerobacter syntrophicus]|uniref:rod-binding protein n=1 Tax=Tepidanaerobacter syntrophicus TaxID=224999 RepID=UPI0023539A7F